MLLAKKIIATNIVIGGAFLATAGTAALTYALFDPDAREKLKGCADKFRDTKNKMSNSTSLVVCSPRIGLHY